MTIDFLGFSFDGKQVTIRPKTISKYYYRMYSKAKTIRRNSWYTSEGKKISKKNIYQRYSIRGAYNKKGNFLTYVERAKCSYGKDEASVWIRQTALSFGLCLIWNQIISRIGKAMIVTMIPLSFVNYPLMLTRNQLFKSETEQWLTVQIYAFSTLHIRVAVPIKRCDMQKRQMQILSIYVNDSTFRLQFCISVWRKFVFIHHVVIIYDNKSARWFVSKQAMILLKSVRW